MSNGRRITRNLRSGMERNSLDKLVLELFVFEKAEAAGDGRAEIGWGWVVVKLTCSKELVDKVVVWVLFSKGRARSSEHWRCSIPKTLSCSTSRSIIGLCCWYWCYNDRIVLKVCITRSLSLFERSFFLVAWRDCLMSGLDGDRERLRWLKLWEEQRPFRYWLNMRFPHDLLVFPVFAEQVSKTVFQGRNLCRWNMIEMTKKNDTRVSSDDAMTLGVSQSGGIRALLSLN